MDSRALPEGFDGAAPLRSTRMELRPMQAEDRGALTHAAGDAAIWAGHPERERWRPEVFGPYFDMLLAAGGTLVARESEGRVIGMSRFYATSDTAGGICIGYTFLIRDHWGGASNLEMKRLMLDHLFASVAEAWFHIAPTNIRSQKATAKLGAERMEQMRLDTGAGPADWVRMRLTRDRWRGRLT